MADPQAVKRRYIDQVANNDLPVAFPVVQGLCPEGCGQTLFLGAEGYVTCSYLSCPNPTAVTALLDPDWLHEGHGRRI